MEERRRFVRLDARVAVRYTVLPDGLPREAVSKGLGGGGLCFVAERVIPPGSRLQVAMELPGREPPIHFTATVVWSEAYELLDKQERRRLAEVGVQVVEIAPQDHQALLDSLALRFKSPHP